jgi:gamma-glutamylcyclotransferase (GGCT)/AIG2-like uncharacterized protein YtfP
MNVFTYGSLMYAPVWERVVCGRYRSAPARLDGWRRHALAGVTYPGAVVSHGAAILGRVYFDIGGDDLLRLDAFEGGEYRRDTVHVVLPEAAGASAPAQVYAFLDGTRLRPHDWDAALFVREHLSGFADAHVGAGGAPR